MSVEKRSFILRSMYALCLLGATYNHIMIVAKYGVFWNYGADFPQATTLFWTSLTIIDPTITALLFLRPNLGIVATSVLMIVDVVNNVSIDACYFPPLLHALSRDVQVDQQIAFLIFVFVTAAFAWHRPPSLTSQYKTH